MVRVHCDIYCHGSPFIFALCSVLPNIQIFLHFLVLSRYGFIDSKTGAPCADEKEIYAKRETERRVCSNKHGVEKFRVNFIALLNSVYLCALECRHCQ